VKKLWTEQKENQQTNKPKEKEKETQQNPQKKGKKREKQMGFVKGRKEWMNG
jgi:hypothetical protein